jgi:hypothetical protein
MPPSLWLERQRPRSGDDDAPTARQEPRPRLETATLRSFCAEVAAFVEGTRSLDVSHDEGVLQSTLRHILFHVLLPCWGFAGRSTDCFESVRQFASAFPVRLLTAFGGYDVSESGQYLHLRSVSTCGGAVVPLYNVGSLACAIAEIVGQQEILPRRPHVRISAVGCRSFLWDLSQNAVPHIASAVCGAEVVVAWDTIITHSGAHAIALANGFFEFSAHYRYGVGISTFVRQHGDWKPVSCGTYASDALAGLAVMLAPSGPLIVHVHAFREEALLETSPSRGPQHCPEAAKGFVKWCSELLSAPTPLMAFISGPYAEEASAVFLQRATRMSGLPTALARLVLCGREVGLAGVGGDELLPEVGISVSELTMNIVT